MGFSTFSKLILKVTVWGLDFLIFANYFAKQGRDFFFKYYVHTILSQSCKELSHVALPLLEYFEQIRKYVTSKLIHLAKT